MQELRQSTEVKVVIGPFVDVSDGFTPETGVDLSTADEAEIMKHNAAAVTSIAAATWAAIGSADGYYNLTLTTSLTDTLGMLTVIVQDDSVCLPVKKDFMVVSQQFWDSKYSTDKLQVHVDEMTAGIITATVIADAAIDFATFAADCKTGTGLKANVESISANAITATAINADAITSAKIADDAISSEHIATGALTADAFAADALVAATFATDSISADAIKADALAEIADAVWDEASTGHTDAGKAGAQLWTDIDAILADTGTDGVLLSETADLKKMGTQTIPTSDLFIT